MDLLPSLPKVFSLVIQAKRQQSIGLVPRSLDTFAFSVNASSEQSTSRIAIVATIGRGRWDHPIRTYCVALGIMLISITSYTNIHLYFNRNSSKEFMFSLCKIDMLLIVVHRTLM